MLLTWIENAGRRAVTGRRWTTVCIASAVLVLVAAAVLTVVIRHPRKTVSPTVATTRRSAADAAADHAAHRALAREKLNRNLEWADRQQSQVIADEIAAINTFFTEAEKNTPAFADDVLGWRSKCYLVADKLPFTRTDRHIQFLRSRFDADLFTSDGLTQKINQSIKDFVDRSNGIENQMLVRMRLDVENLPETGLPSFASDQTLREAFDRSILESKGRVGPDAVSAAGEFVTSLVVQQVLSMVATRLGISAGILGVGAGSSAETLGISLIVTIVIDRIVSWVWDRLSDPKGNLARAMTDRLEQMRKQILYGSKPGDGLLSVLDDLAKKRSMLRQQFVESVTR